MSLDRKGMLEVIRNGGSVLYNGKLITKEEHIVKALSMTPEGAKSERARLQAQIDALPKEEAESAAASDDLSKKTKVELLELAGEKGNELMTKSQIIELIEGGK